MKTFIANSPFLSHLDISAMNFSREQSITLASACAQSETLIGVHFSDNGIRYDQDWAEELIDCFGLSAAHVWPQQEHGYNFTYNMKTKDPHELRQVVNDSVLALDK